MLDKKDPWTTALVILVSMIAVKLGVNNLESSSKTVGDIMTHVQTSTKK